MTQAAIEALYIGRRSQHFVFDFRCPCGYFSELGVPYNQKAVITCCECGKLYVLQVPTGMFGTPQIIAVSDTPRA